MAKGRSLIQKQRKDTEMSKKRYHALLILEFTFAVVLPVCHLSGDVRDYFYPNENNCGITEEISEDARTLSPWTVAIFIRKNVRSPFRYFLTGTLVGTTTVMTIFGGSYGQPSYKKKSRRYHIPPPSNFLLVAGIPSTDLNDMDEFSQMAEVSKGR
ncbi:unnamed protein product [Allacma fusca]|uniref:Transmembrane protein n=1 Tax=Allacma fusca TaxID=39272 RepID=A0A8J2NU96_9HEXA|nr:unnamed protein product [Allacma fusca]